MPLLRAASLIFAVNSRQLTMATNNCPPSASGPIERSIREKLTLLLRPITLTITNDSYLHRHHAAMKDYKYTGETHFSVAVVSDVFQGQNTLARHRMIHTALADEFSGGLHALSLATKTPEEIPKV